MPPRKPRVFFAIPCGDFYSIQRRIIDEVAGAADIDAIVVEDDPETEGLWAKIAEQIQSADSFVADISSHSPNILFELGYALRQQSNERIGVFASAAANIPVDLQGFVLQKYFSFADFQGKLVRWLCRAIPMLDDAQFANLPTSERRRFRDDFCDFDRFLRLWSPPPGCSYFLTHEGLQFTNAGFPPLLTTTLALLADCEFEFRARIERGALGWVVKGTKDTRYPIPRFCVMFNVNQNGDLLPHILNLQHWDPKSIYQRFPTEQVKASIQKSDDNWFTLLTRVRGHTIEIENEGTRIFSADFSKEPYARFYNDVADKEGEVGFRCDFGEEATIRRMEVRELTEDA